MDQAKSFERRYSINVARLKEGSNEEAFQIDEEFFEFMKSDLISRADLMLQLNLVKYHRHIDARFHFVGTVFIPCDRCDTPYPQKIDDERRIIYSFDEEMKFDGYEVIYVEPQEPKLLIMQEIFDFVHLALPMRRLANPEVHLCDPEILAVLGLDEKGQPKEAGDPEESDGPIDERWAALKKLKDQMND